MVRPYNKLFTLATTSGAASYFANDVSGASWALAHNTAPDSLAHQITILNNTGNSHVGQTITIVGLDQDGFSQTETITGPGPSATVTSTFYYSSITSVTPSSTFGADTVDIGYSNTISGPTFPLSWREGVPYIDVYVTGTLNGTVQYTGDLINMGAVAPYNWITESGSVMTNFTGSVISSPAVTYSSVPIAVRLIINSYSTGATALFQISQKNF